jgi:hypothetical protein
MRRTFSILSLLLPIIFIFSNALAGENDFEGARFGMHLNRVAAILRGRLPNHKIEVLRSINRVVVHNYRIGGKRFDINLECPFGTLEEYWIDRSNPLRENSNPERDAEILKKFLSKTYGMPVRDRDYEFSKGIGKHRISEGSFSGYCWNVKGKSVSISFTNHGRVTPVTIGTVKLIKERS